MMLQSFLKSLKWYWYVILILVISSVGIWQYYSWLDRAKDEQHAEELEVIFTALENQIDLKNQKQLAIDTMIFDVKEEIKTIQVQDKILIKESEQLKLKKDELQSFINRASESVIDSILRST